MAVGDNAVTFKGIQEEGLLPASMATEIMTKAYGESLVGRLAGSTPMPITGTSIAFQTGDPVAGVVGEGDLKPVIKTGVATKSATPIKVAATVYWSKEARMANPLGYLGMLENTAKDAIAKAIDMAVLHGKNALTGSAIAGVESVAQTANAIELGSTTADNGGLAGDILAGYETVEAAGGDITGFAADTSMRLRLLSARDSQGRPIYGTDASGMTDLKDPVGVLLGLPVAYGRAVKGKMGAVADTNIRMFGGAFQDNLKFGYVEQIAIKRSDQATIIDGGSTVHLWQQNMEAFLIEAMFGWIIRDVNQFVKFTVPAV